MRFRKRIKIMKGLSLNLSKSGLSVSAGVRGASITMGRRGTFLNTGIPGTGLYNRTKISSPSPSYTRNHNHYSNNSVDTNTQVNVSITLDEKGAPVLSLKDANDNPILNESIIRIVKRSTQYKEGVEKLIRERKEEIESEANKFINIYTFTPQIINEEFVVNELQILKPEEYIIKPFDKPALTRDDVITILQEDSKQYVHTILFWKLKKLRKEFVDENLEKTFVLETEKWEKNKTEYNNKENNLKIEANAQFEKEYLEKKTHLENYLSGDSNYVNEMIEEIIKETTLPVEFSLDYEYKPELNKLFIDLDLPEIQNMPKEKANILASGKISIKNKTNKEINYDYSRCICGIAFYFAGTFFNITSKIKEIIISGYTLRLNPINGKDENQYIYSVRFKRDTFAELNIKEIDPIQGFLNFQNNIKISNSFEFKTIEPIHN